MQPWSAQRFTGEKTLSGQWLLAAFLCELGADSAISAVKSFKACSNYKITQFPDSLRSMDYIFTPWRYAYITDAAKSDGKSGQCIFCELTKLPDDEAKIRFLYERIWQRLPRPEELNLGLDFVSEEKPANKLTSSDSSAESVSINSGDAQNIKPRFAGRPQFRRAGGPGFRRREPLKIWEEYAHALLQANETSFVN